MRQEAGRPIMFFGIDKANHRDRHSDSQRRISYADPWLGPNLFWKPIKRDGRTLTTLDDARELISTLPPTAQVAERWLDADEMLVRAEASPSARDDALAAVVRALKAEGLI